jgi:5-methyltetrahydrofolate--homocysteine methyltransferase
VFGSVGPTGELIEPVGTTSAKDVYAAFKQQVLALEKGGVDGIVIETMISLEEAKIAISAVKENTQLPVAALTTFDKGPRGFFTMMGDTPEKCYEELFLSDADIVGANCGNGIDIMIELGQRFRECGDGHVWINCNAGIPQIQQGQIIYPETPEYMLDGFSKLIDMGVNIVGGCCGTTPDHIRQIANL